jgi:hypothetical protein
MIDFSLESPDTISDCIEALVLTQKGRPLPVQKLHELALSLFNLESNIVNFNFNNLRKREKLLGNLYPFEINESYLVCNADLDQNVYLQLLVLSPKNIFKVTEKNWSLEIASKTFEKLTEKCLENFFGPKTQTVNFGYPSSSGRPSDFTEAVKWFSQISSIKLGNAYRSPRMKDGGVDLFVWRNFSDSRSGIPLLLVQCTIGEDFINKIGDIDIRLWANWLSTDIEPLIALAVPNFVTKQEIWDEITARGILLDRGRLIELNSGNHLELANESKTYLTRVLDDFVGSYL